MATMVKEKCRDKKKGKTKRPSILSNISSEEKQGPSSDVLQEQQCLSINVIQDKDYTRTDAQERQTSTSDSIENKQICLKMIGSDHKTYGQSSTITKAYDNVVDEKNKFKQENLNAKNLEIGTGVTLLEDTITPSAPILEENLNASFICPGENIIEKVQAKISCMPMEEVIRLFGGKEIAEVKVLSAKEEAFVEAGLQSGPDHPLVDLLSTFRTSLIAIEREHNRLSCGYVDEEKSRATLWKVKKCSVNILEKCPCGAQVALTAVFDVAKLDRERMPAARLKLESLFRDVQECYCHHQHAALQAHYDIDDLLAEISQSDKGSIRVALMLVLQALQLSDAAPETFAQALQRWAGILSHSLLDQRDLGHFLFLLHSLFRQTRSVRWAGRVVDLLVPDTPSAAKLLVVLELLLTRPLLEEAQECTEDSEMSEAWEEVDNHGEGGAVGEGRFRERDLLALLDALPLQDLLARILLFARNDIGQEDEQSWGDKSGGHGVLKASCGVRVLLAVLRRALRSHTGYVRLRLRLRQLAAAALTSLAALHQHSRCSYTQVLEERITVELEACFAAGLRVLAEESHRLSAALLSSAAAREYCNTLITGLHETHGLYVAALAAASAPQSCAMRVRAVMQAALDRELDHDLAETVLSFLFQIGIKRQSAVCKGSCDVTARELLPQLLAQHQLHTAALQTLADLSQVEAIEPSLLQPLAPRQWRPGPAELWALLDGWAARCSQLIQHLLLNLDYTPLTGVSLETQLSIGTWLCSWLHAKGEAPEWAWQVMRALRVHRTQWNLPLEAASHERPVDQLSTAFALLASDWGHCVPLGTRKTLLFATLPLYIVMHQARKYKMVALSGGFQVCGPGVEALARLAEARPADAVLCLGPIMRVMAQSPESVSLTPKFAEVFVAIFNSGPSLVQRALGRRGSTGQELLQQLLIEHMQDSAISQQERSALLSAWLHALWKPTVPAAGRAALDAAARVAQDWRALDAHAALLLQEEDSKEYITDAVRNVIHAPLLCESVLRNAHALEIQTQLHARVTRELAKQRAAAQKIHVDNALKQIGSPLLADELAIHRCACAVLSSSPQHPAHLLLWRLLLHIYLQRSSAPQESTTPVGRLFFSGIIKSRTLSQLKKRLQETAAYHSTQAETLKCTSIHTASPNSAGNFKNSSSTVDKKLFSSLAIFDLTGVSDSESDSSLSERDNSRTDNGSAKETNASCDTHNLICYHSAAGKIVREYLVWLEEGEKVRARPHHADIARFLSEQALETAWRSSLDKGLFSPTTPASPFTAPPPPSIPHTTHCERAIQAIGEVKRKRRRRFKIPVLSSTNSYSWDTEEFVPTIQKDLLELEKLTRAWMSDLDRVTRLDAQLWELVGKLRACRPLPAVRKSCPQNCKPITIHIPREEWCVSSGAEHGIQNNRRSAEAALRQLSRPRAHDARVTSRLHGMGRRIRSRTAALRVAELAYAAAPGTQAYAPAHAAVCALLADIAARFICGDAKLATESLKRWSKGGCAQQNLCLLLIKPTQMDLREWPRLYTAILNLGLPPHVTFTYISKFDLTAWADAVDTVKRSALLEALLKAAQRLGPRPDEQHMVLLELLGVHSLSVARRDELCAHIARCARACVTCSLSSLFLSHLPGVVDRYGDGVDFDQLGHFLRQLGLIFWEARSAEATSRVLFGAYAPHFGNTLYALLREFVAAAVGRTYEPERVGVYAWSAVREAWSAWVAPHCSAPLLPSTADAEGYTDMLARFTDTIKMIMQDCPGCEDVLLRHIFEWTVQCYLGMKPQWPQESRVQVSALLAHLASLPWQRQWFHVDVLQLSLQVSRLPEQELTSWCCSCMRHLQADTWLRGVSDEHMAPTLTTLLDIFISKQLSLPYQTLNEACRLPWARLSELALSYALERYFSEHHSLTLPYHQAAQFRVLLAACHLIVAEDCMQPRSPRSSDKRATGVSQWVRAASAPELRAHVREHSECLLETLTNLAPQLEESTGELEQLLGRAVVIMCIESAAPAALPVWQKWVRTCPLRLRRAAVSAAAALTTLEYSAALGDAVAKAILAEKESAGWSELATRWAPCLWPAGALAARGALHAAYATLLASPPAPAQLYPVFSALLTADINFAADDAIVAVWICVACRVALRPDCADAGQAARALLTRGAEQKRTLLQVVTLQSSDNCPTPQQRLLCRLALCVVSPSEGAARAFASACGPLLSAAEAATWTRAPRPPLLPRLATRLYPHQQVYFKEELDLLPEFV